MNCNYSWFCNSLLSYSLHLQPPFSTTYFSVSIEIKVLYLKVWLNLVDLNPQFSSVQSFSHVRLFATPWNTAPRPPCPSPTPGVYSNSCPLSQYAIQPSHPLSTPSPPALNHIQHQGLFKWVSSSIWWPKYWSFSLSISVSNEYPGLFSFRMDWLDLLAVQGLLRVFSNATVQKHQFFGAQLSL